MHFLFFFVDLNALEFNQQLILLGVVVFVVLLFVIQFKFVNARKAKWEKKILDELKYNSMFTRAATRLKKGEVAVKDPLDEFEDPAMAQTYHATSRLSALANDEAMKHEMLLQGALNTIDSQTSVDSGFLEQDFVPGKSVLNSKIKPQISSTTTTLHGGGMKAPSFVPTIKPLSYDVLVKEQEESGLYPERLNRFKLRVKDDKSEFKFKVGEANAGLDVSIKPIKGPPKGSVVQKSVFGANNSNSSMYGSPQNHSPSGAIGNNFISSGASLEGGGSSTCSPSRTWLSASGKAMKFHQPKYAFSLKGRHNGSPLGDGTFNRAFNFNESLTLTGSISEMPGPTVGAVGRTRRSEFRGEPGSLRVMGPGMWHALSAQAAYMDVRPHQTLIPEDRIYDEIDLFLEVLDRRIDIERKFSSSNQDSNQVAQHLGIYTYGPGRPRPQDDSNVGVQARDRSQQGLVIRDMW